MRASSGEEAAAVGTSSASSNSRTSSGSKSIGAGRGVWVGWYEATNSGCHKAGS